MRAKQRLVRRTIASICALSVALLPLMSVQPATAAVDYTHDYRWSRTPSPSNGGMIMTRATATDNGGNIYVAGAMQGTVTMDGPNGHDAITAGNSYAGFVSKYDASGAYQWTRVFKNEDGAMSTVLGIAVDNWGRLYLTGSFSGSVTFDGPEGSDQIDSNAPNSSFITSYNNDGTYGWTNYTEGVTGDSWSGTVAVDHNGNIYLGGNFSGNVNFNGRDHADNQTGTSDSFDYFVTKYDSTGSYQWTRIGAATDGVSSVVSVSTDGGDNVYIGGTFSGTVTFDQQGSTDTVSSPVDNDNGFYTKFDTDGTYLFTRTFDASNGSASVTGLTTDWDGNVFITGAYSGSMLFDGPGGTDTQTSSGGQAGFVVHYEAGGMYRWAKTLDTNGGSVRGGGIALDRKGNVYITGMYYGAVTFDGPSGNDTRDTGGNDYLTFLTRFSGNGTYGWTETTGSGSANTMVLSAPAIAIHFDNAYIASYFTGKLIMDGPGGSDSVQTGTNVYDSFLISWRLSPRFAEQRSGPVVAITAPADGYVASNGTVAVSGTSVANASITVKIDGTTAGSATANANGNWSFTATHVPTGNHTITAQYSTNHPIAYLGDAGSVVYLVDTVTRAGIGTLDAKPTSVAYSPNGTVLIAGYNDDYSGCVLTYFNPATGKTKTLGEAADCSYNGIAFNQAGDTAYAVKNLWGGSNEVVVVDMTNGSLQGSHNLPDNPETATGVSISPSGDQLWVVDTHQLAVYYLEDFSTIATIDYGGGSSDSNIAFANSKAYVSDQPRGIIHVYDTNIVENSITELPRIGNDVIYNNVAATPDGSKLYAVSRDQRLYSVIDTQDNSITGDYKLDETPESVGFTADGQHFVIGDDHNAGIVYFGDTANDTVVDGVAFDGGSFSSYNSNFISPHMPVVFGASIAVSVAGQSSTPPGQNGSGKSKTSKPADDIITFLTSQDPIVATASPENNDTSKNHHTNNANAASKGNQKSFLYELLSSRVTWIVSLLLLFLFIILFYRKRSDREKQNKPKHL